MKQLNEERTKINDPSMLFVVITDERDIGEVKEMLTDNDILLCWNEEGKETTYANFPGPFMSLRRIMQVGISSMTDDMDAD
jgi:hypothetical protein